MKGKANSVSEEMIAKIKQANWADIELYEFVKQLFWRQVKTRRISLEEVLFERLHKIWVFSLESHFNSTMKRHAFSKFIKIS